MEKERAQTQLRATSGPCHQEAPGLKGRACVPPLGTAASSTVPGCRWEGQPPRPAPGPRTALACNLAAPPARLQMPAPLRTSPNLCFFVPGAFTEAFKVNGSKGGAFGDWHPFKERKDFRRTHRTARRGHLPGEGLGCTPMAAGPGLPARSSGSCLLFKPPPCVGSGRLTLQRVGGSAGEGVGAAQQPRHPLGVLLPAARRAVPAPWGPGQAPLSLPRPQHLLSSSTLEGSVLGPTSLLWV